MHQIKLWEPCINKILSSDILLNIFIHCDPSIRNVCNYWNKLIIKDNYIWGIWYNNNWSKKKLKNASWVNNYYKMILLDNNWFKDKYIKKTFYENAWVMDSVLTNKFVFSGSKWGIIKSWEINDILNSKLCPKVYSGHLGPISCLDFDVNKELIISGSQDGTIRLWKLNDYNYIKMLTYHTNEVYFVKIYKNKIYSGSRDLSIKIYDLETQEVKTLLGHTNSVWCIDFDEYDNIYSCSLDGTVKYWNLKTMTCERSILVDNLSVLKVCYINGLLFIGKWNGIVEIWKDFKKIYELNINQSFISSLKVVDDKLITAGYDDQIKIFKIIYKPKFDLILKNMISVEKITSVGISDTKLVVTNSYGKISFYDFAI